MLPCGLGMEASGIIKEVGPNVSEFSVGDKIVFEKRMSNKIQIDDKTYYLVLENYVYGRLQNEQRTT